MSRTAIHFAKYILGLDRAETQTTQAERDVIAKYAHGKRRAVEIGVFEGVTTGVIAAALDSQGTIYGIDPFTPGRMGICWGKPIARREARRMKPRCSIVFVEQFSNAAASSVDGAFDFIFIDGNHSWDGIAQDWRDWSHRIDPNGIIALHDTRVPEHNPRVADLGSHKYFEQHIRRDDRFRLLEQIDSLSVLVRL